MKRTSVSNPNSGDDLSVVIQWSDPRVQTDTDLLKQIWFQYLRSIMKYSFFNNVFMKLRVSGILVVPDHVTWKISFPGENPVRYYEFITFKWNTVNQSPSFTQQSASSSCKTHVVMWRNYFHQTLRPEGFDRYPQVIGQQSVLVSCKCS